MLECGTSEAYVVMGAWGVTGASVPVKQDSAMETNGMTEASVPREARVVSIDGGGGGGNVGIGTVTESNGRGGTGLPPLSRNEGKQHSLKKAVSRVSITQAVVSSIQFGMASKNERLQEIRDEVCTKRQDLCASTKAGFRV